MSLNAAPFFNLYQVKYWVDVLDQGNVWRLARIKKDSEGLLTVSFDGWSSKYNMVVIYTIHRYYVGIVHD